ncbi:hypothetical protein HanIR_Chr15g0740831 [Helianthus annuus]|nr:hypothetical protein HanIR_Chr15g0740831 [Helianthus annuus]
MYTMVKHRSFSVSPSKDFVLIGLHFRPPLHSLSPSINRILSPPLPPPSIITPTTTSTSSPSYLFSPLADHYSGIFLPPPPTHHGGSREFRRWLCCRMSGHRRSNGWLSRKRSHVASVAVVQALDLTRTGYVGGGFIATMFEGCGGQNP